MIEGALVIGTLLLYIFLGIRSQRGIKTLEDYTQPSRGYGSLVLMMTLTASYIGGAGIIGTAEKTYQLGISYLLLLMAFPLQMVILFFLASRIKRSMSEYMTVGEAIGVHYGKPGRVVFALMWALFALIAISIQSLALGKALNFYLEVPYPLGVLLGSGTVILYTYFGGIKGVIATDVIQFILFMVLLPATLVYLGLHIDWQHKVPETYWNPLNGFTVQSWWVLFISFIVSDCLLPPEIQRVKLAKSIASVRGMYLMTSLSAAFILTVAGGFGILAYTQNPNLDPTQVVSFLLRETSLPVGLKEFGLLALLATILSTADSYYNSASQVIVRDFIAGLRRTPLSARSELSAARITLLSLGALSVVIAMSEVPIYDLYLMTHQFWGPVVVVPFVFFLVGKPMSKKTCYTAVILAVMTTILWQVLQLELVTALSPGLAGQSANLLVGLVGYSIHAVQREQMS